MEGFSLAVKYGYIALAIIYRLRQNLAGIGVLLVFAALVVDVCNAAQDQKRYGDVGEKTKPHYSLPSRKPAANAAMIPTSTPWSPIHFSMASQR